MPITPWAPAPGLVTYASYMAQTTPKMIAHRGLSQVAPENTLVAYRAAIAAMQAQNLVPAIKTDVYLLGDGSLGVMHDSTVNRTTTSTGNNTNYTADTWKTLVANTAIVGPAWASDGWGMTLLTDLLTDLGGRCVLFIECKNNNAASVTAACQAIVARGLAGSCVLVGEDTTLTLPGIAAGFGIGWWYYWLANPITAPVTPAQAVAARGVTGLGASVNQGNAYADADVTTIVSTAHARGLPANGFAYTRRYDYTRAISQFNIDVHVTNDMYVSTTNQAFTTDQFSIGAPVPGEVGTTLLPTGSVYAPGYSYAGGPGFYRRQMTAAEGLGGIFEALGFMGPTTNPGNSTHTFTGTMFWDVTETSTTDGATFGGVLVCATDDRFFNSNAFASGYQCAIRQGNGSTYSVPTLQIYKQNPGAYQNNGSYAVGSGVQLVSHPGTPAYAPPNTLGANLTAGVAVTTITVGSATTLPSGIKMALPNGQIATVNGAVSASTAVTVNSITPASNMTSGQAVSFGIPFSILIDTTTAGSTKITFTRTDSGDTTGVVTDSASPYTGPYIHLGKAGTGSGGSTLTMSYANLTVT